MRLNINTPIEIDSKKEVRSWLVRLPDFKSGVGR